MSASQPAPTRRSARQHSVKSYREQEQHDDDDDHTAAFDDTDIADVENSYHPNRPSKRRRAAKPVKPVKAATQPDNNDDEWREGEDELNEYADGDGRHYTDEQLLDDSDIRLDSSDRSEESDAGVVLKVVLVNFMVHQHFTATLNKHITFIHGPNGSGKCFARGTVLRLYNGDTMAVEAVRGGERLMGDDGQPRIVTPGSLVHYDPLKRAEGEVEQPLYRICPHWDGAQPFTVNGAHTLVLLNTTKPYVTKRSDTLAESWQVKAWEVNTDNRMVNRSLGSFSTEARAKRHLATILARPWEPVEWQPTVDEFLCTAATTRRLCLLVACEAITFNNPLLPSLHHLLTRVLDGVPPTPAQLDYMAWWLGIWLSNGHCGTAAVFQGGISPPHPHHDHPIFARLLDYQRLFNQPVQQADAHLSTARWPGRWFRYGVGSVVDLVLQAYGLIGNKHIPRALICDSLNVRRRLLAGLIDGDGSYDSQRNAYEVQAKDRQAIDGYKELAATLGLRNSSVLSHDCTDQQTGVQYRGYRISISGHMWDAVQYCCVATYKHCPQPGSVDYVENNKNSRCYGFTITPVGSGEYFGFAVHGGINRRFLLQDYTVTHNSAILVALQTVFGAHMRDTNRGSSLAQLIRAGCRDQTARVTVYLQNDGPQPYTPLTLNGQPYKQPLPHPLVLRMTIVGKLDSALPQMQSRKWELGIPEGGRDDVQEDDDSRRVRWVKLTVHELHQLTQYFNIQVSNPCVILTQESGKKFLNSGSAADKYSFFYQATQLDVLKEKHDAGEARIQQMKEEIKGGKEQLKTRQRRRDELAEWVERKEKKDRAEMALKLAQAQEKWSEWKDKTEELERSKQSAQMQAEELTRQSQRVAELERQNGAFDSSRREKEQLVHNKQQEAAAATAAVQAAEETAAQDHARMRALENRVEALRKTKERAMREQQRKEREVEQMRKEMEEQNAQVNEQRQKRLDELDTQRQRWLAQKDEHTAAYQRIRAEQTNLASQLSAATALHQRSRQSLQDAEAQLQRLRSSQQRGGSAFGARTREIRDECQRRQSEFDVLPVGPVGDYLQIPDREDERFLFAIEVAIGRAMLQGYICHSLKDSRVLLSILRRLFPDPKQQPQIYIQPRRDTREYHDPKAANLEHPYGPERRVLDCLDVKLDWVYNVLVDQREVEAILLIPRDGQRDGEYNRRAYQVFDRYKDAKVRAVYTETGAQVRGTGDNRGMTPAPFVQGGRLLVVDIGQEVRRMESKRDDVKREEEHHRREIGRMQAEQQEVQRRLDRMQASIRSVDQEVNLIDGQVAEIESERRNMRREEDLLPLQAEQQRLSAEVADLDGQVQDAADKAQVQKVRVREAEGAVQQARGQEEEAMQRVMLARAELDNFATSRQQRESSIQREKTKLAKLTDHHTTVLQTISRAEPQLHIDRQQLQSMYPTDEFHDWHGGLDTLTRGHRYYQQEVQKRERELRLLMEKIQEAVRRQRGGGREVNVDRMFNEYKKVEAECEEVEVRIGVLEIDSRCLETAMKARQQKWLQYRSVLTERLKQHFSVYLSRSGKAGEIQIDHSKAELYIHSIRGLHDPLPAQPNLYSSLTMSGGEKSIVTVAFLMSMWQSVDCPWRAMDEFDVFQDTVNRHRSLRLLIKGAHQTRQRQFLFLTPLDVKDVVAEDGVKVVQMPRRDERQGVLPFSAEQS